MVMQLVKKTDQCLIKTHKLTLSSDILRDEDDLDVLQNR